jgi:CheY-like chemotaxis protein
MNKVFCIDDDTVALMLYKIMLNKSLFCSEIITALNGQEALNYYSNLLNSASETEKSEYPRLIFLDLNMPVMGGWEFLDNFSNSFFKHFEETKVIVLSSTIDPEDFEKAKQYPMVIKSLSKPLTRDMLKYIKEKLI